MNSVILEIRAAEGGEHARVLVRKQLEVYLRFATRKGL